MKWLNPLFGLLLGLSIGLAVSPCSAQTFDLSQEPARCASDDSFCTRNDLHTEGKSYLCARIRVEDGKPKVDRTNSCLYVTSLFLERLRPSKLTLAEVKETLFDRIDSALAQSERLVYYSLSENDRELLKRNSCQTLSTEEGRRLCAFSGDWQTFIARYQLWQTTITPPSTLLPDRLLVNEDIDGYLPEINLDSSMSFRDSPGATYNGREGVILFRLANPIGDFKDTDQYGVCIADKCEAEKKSDDPRTVAAPGDIRQLLSPLKGQLWNRITIISVIQEYYAGKGLLATVDVTNPFDNDKPEIKIKESPRIFSISFSSDLDDSQIDKAMYILLPDRQFRRFRKCREDFEPAADAVDQRFIVEIERLLRRGDCDSDATTDLLPYLNLTKLQMQTLQLNSIDLDVAVGSTTDAGEEYVFLEVAPVEKAKKKTDQNKTDQAAPLANEQGVVDPNLVRPETQNSFTPRVDVKPSSTPAPSSTASPSPEPTATPEPSPTPSPNPTASPSPEPTATPEPSPETEPTGGKKKKNYVGGGFDYRSGEGFRLIGIYQRNELFFGNDGLSLRVGGHEKALGSLNYFADYVAFSRLGRRLILQLTGSSDLRAQRIFAGQNTDERRTGGLAKAELELFRDRGGNQLRLSLEAQHMTVELSQNDAIISKQNLSTIDLGGLYVIQPDYELDYPRWGRLEPRLRFGLGLAKDEPRFNSLTIAGNFHQKLPRFLELDIAGRAGLASRKTPFFELPALGGSDSVRGFRRDEAIGRKMWSLQNELWVPLPGTINSIGEFQRFLRRSVRLAGFADVGGIYHTTDSEAGTRFGPGAGIRFIFNPVIMKIDWAYGLSSTAVTTGRGRFSFSIGSNLPF